MKEFFKSFACKVLGLIALVLIGVMIYAASTGGFSTIPAAISGAVITPLQTAITSLSDGVSGFFGQFGGSGELRKQLEEKDKEILELRQKVIDYDKMKEENDWYAEILGLHEQHSDFTFEPGRIIAVDPSGEYGNFSINAGSVNGISAGDPVVTAEGLVGVVYEVNVTSAKVRTILDPATRASATISRNGDTGTTGGSVALAQKGRFRLNKLERNSGAAVGDIVVTSGFGGVFPSGLSVGKIIAVTPESDGLTLYATVEPYVDLGALKNVMVITSFAGQGEGVE